MNELNTEQIMDRHSSRSLFYKLCKNGFVSVCCLILLIAGFGACSSFDGQLVQTDSIVFKTGFSFKHKPSGMFYDRTMKKTCYYFGNLATGKRIGIFDDTGNKLYSIPLNKVFWQNEQVDNVEVRSPDTVLVLSQYTNKLFFLNRRGEIWKSIDLNPYLQDDSLWNFELSSSYYSQLFYKKDGLALALNSGLSQLGKQKYDEEEFTINYWRLPQLVSVQELFSDSVRIKKGFDLYRQIDPDDSLYFNMEVKSFLINGNRVFAHSVYSDELFEVDANSLRVENIVALKSECTSIGAKRVKVAGRGLQEILEETRKRWQTGYISAHFYNDLLQHHYVIVAKETIEGFFEENEFVPWVLLICDDQLNVINEVNFNDGEYEPFLVPSSNGFMLRKANVKGENFNNQKLVFHEFTY